MYLFFNTRNAILHHHYTRYQHHDPHHHHYRLPPANTMSLLPPPEAINPDPATAFNAIQLHAKEYGYAFMKRNEKPSRLLFACNRAGNYDSRGKVLTVDKSRQRKNTGSKKCGCLMMVELCLDQVVLYDQLVLVESLPCLNTRLLLVQHLLQSIELLKSVFM